MKRVRYFYGQLLTAADFRAEQQYQLEKHKRHNRLLHGYGVVYGLEVSLHDGTIHVSPGFALDCEGNEISVDDEVVFRLPDSRASIYVTVLYVERETDAVPAVGGEGEGAAQNSRIEEGFQLGLQRDNPCQRPEHLKAVRFPCGRLHPIPLARLSFTRAGRRIDRRFHPPRAGMHQAYDATKE